MQESSSGQQHTATARSHERRGTPAARRGMSQTRSMNEGRYHAIREINSRNATNAMAPPTPAGATIR